MCHLDSSGKLLEPAQRIELYNDCAQIFRLTRPLLDTFSIETYESVRLDFIIRRFF